MQKKHSVWSAFLMFFLDPSTSALRQAQGPSSSLSLAEVNCYLLQFLQSGLVLRNDGHFRFAQVPNAGLGHVQINLPATLGLRICPVEKLSQILQGCFVLGDNFSLRSELGAFGVHDSFRSAIDELLYFRFAQVPNAGLGHAHASVVATLGLRICHWRATSALSMPLRFWQ